MPLKINVIEEYLTMRKLTSIITTASGFLLVIYFIYIVLSGHDVVPRIGSPTEPRNGGFLFLIIGIVLIAHGLLYNRYKEFIEKGKARGDQGDSM
jgi:hypothetical protein